MYGIPITTLLMLIPILGMLFIALTEKKNIIGIKSVALWITAFALLFSLIIAIAFDYSQKIYIEEATIFKNAPVKYKFGIDTLSAIFVPIICMICFTCIMWIAKNKANKLICINILFFETLAIGAFYAWDLFLLYACIEATIIPMYYLMSIQKDKSIDAISHFFMYTIISAVFILLAFILIYLETNTTNIKEIQEIGIRNEYAFWLLIIGIGIKLPVFPFYSWLPKAHVKSHTICSVLLASVVLKFGSLLIVRFIQPLFFGILKENINIVSLITLLSIIVSTIQMVRQKDIKSVFAYFSIIHLNMAIFILLCDANGFIYSIVSHSFLMIFLFFTSHIIERTYKTRDIKILAETSRLQNTIKIMTFSAFYFLISAPISSGFITEILTFTSVAKFSHILVFVIGFVELISMTFAFNLYTKCFPFWKKSDVTNSNVDIYKVIALCFIATAMISLGLFPYVIL